MSIILFQQSDFEYYDVVNIVNEIEYYQQWIYDNRSIINEIIISAANLYGLNINRSQIGVFNSHEDIPNEIHYYPDWLKQLRILSNSWFLHNLFTALNGEGVFQEIVNKFQSASSKQNIVVALGITILKQVVNSLIYESLYLVVQAEYKKKSFEIVNDYQEILNKFHDIVNVITYNDPIEAKQIIGNSLGLNDEQINSTGFHDIIFLLHDIVNAILPFTYNDKQKLINDIKKEVKDFQDIYFGIDPYDVGSLQNILNAIVDAGYNEYQTIKNAIDTVCSNLMYDVKLYIDGVDYSNKVISCNCRLLQEDKVLPEIQFSLVSDDFIDMNSVILIVNGNQYEFLTEEFDYDAVNKTLSVWGRGTLSEFHTPYVAKQDYNYIKKSVFEIFDELLPGVQKVINIDDTYVNFQTEDTPLNAFKKLVQEIGVYASFSPDNKLYIYYPDTYFNLTDLKNIYNLKKTKKIYEYNSVTINFNKTLGIVKVESDVTEAKINEMVNVRVYTLNPNYTFHTEADYYALVGQRIITERTQTIDFDYQRLSFTPDYPVLRIIEKPDWLIFSEEDNTFYINGDISCTNAYVKYETVYDLYRVTNYTEEKVMVCSVASKNSYTLSIGDGKVNKTIDSGVILDINTAKHKAIYELYQAMYPIELNINCLYDSGVDIYNSAVVFNNRLYYITECSVDIATNPLNAIYQIKVRGK